MDEIGRFSLLKKAHHFFLRAVRCHLVSHFRVYPKITYQLPSLWHSRLSPHTMFVDTDGCPFSVVPPRPPFFVVWLRSQHGHGTFPFDHYHVLSHLFIFGYGRWVITFATTIGVFIFLSFLLLHKYYTKFFSPCQAICSFIRRNFAVKGKLLP